MYSLLRVSLFFLPPSIGLAFAKCEGAVVHGALAVSGIRWQLNLASGAVEANVPFRGPPPNAVLCAKYTSWITSFRTYNSNKHQNYAS